MNSTTIRIVDFLLKDAIIPEIPASCSADAISELVTIATTCLELNAIVADEIKREILALEKAPHFDLGQGFALLYVKHPALSKVAILFGRSKAGIPFSTMDGRPVRNFLLLLSPLPSPPEYQVLFSRILTMLGNRRVRSFFQFVKTTDQIMHAFLEAERELHAAPFTV